MGKEKSLDLKTRRDIYNFILKHPGLHLSELCRRLNLRKNNLDYHLNYLNSQGLIAISSKEGYSTYYGIKIEGKRAESVAILLAKSLPNETKKRVEYIIKYLIPTKKDREILNVIKRKVPNEILVVLTLKPNLSQKKISKLLKKHPTTISFHLKKLIERDVIESTKYGNEVRYRIKNEESLLRLAYLFTGWKEQVNANGKSNGKIDYSKFDSLMDFIYEIFPHPYHV